ncbi:MAG: MopE-related protein [Desulfobulbaceae bacterium]|nr:MopE-related protein [Desulfobulbaceae bacterium]
MKNKILCFIFAAAGALLIYATEGYTIPDYCGVTAQQCANRPTDCNSCHSGPANTACNTADVCYFCPDDPSCVTTPTCTDNDGDTYFAEGGDCGPVDCDDTNAAINPGAAENCTDTIDNNCNDLIDDQDPAAVGCQPVCTDNDGDTFAVEGGDCGQVDCDDTDAAINPDAVEVPNNGIDEDCSGADAVDPTIMDNDGDGYSVADGDCDDTDAAINPGAADIPNNGIDENCDGADSVDTSIIDNDGDGFTPAAGDCDDTDGAVNPNAVEICTDGIDNDCNGYVDTQDANAVDCPQTCFDNDGDTFAIEGGECGPVDCDDNDATINPGVEEICDDGIDNDCDSSIDEGCDVTCPDADSDGYQDAACGGTDCNDTDAAINPGSAEVPGNGIDENCNGASDDVVLTCPDGTLLVIREMEYNQGDEKLHIKGRATAGTTISIINSDTGEILAEGIRVREGKWEAEIKNVGSTLESISVISSNGCAVDQEVGSGEEDREYREDDDDSHEKRNRESRGKKRKSF